jgi:hypothetical protein
VVAIPALFQVVRCASDGLHFRSGPEIRERDHTCAQPV